MVSINRRNHCSERGKPLSMFIWAPDWLEELWTCPLRAALSSVYLSQSDITEWQHKQRFWTRFKVKTHWLLRIYSDEQKSGKSYWKGVGGEGVVFICSKKNAHISKYISTLQFGENTVLLSHVAATVLQVTHFMWHCPQRHYFFDASPQLKQVLLKL